MADVVDGSAGGELDVERLDSGMGRATIGVGTSLLAVLAALVVGAILLIVSGRNPFSAYEALFDGSFGSKFAIGETLARAAPLAIIGCGAAVALRAGVITIGAQGQVIAGAIGAFLTAQLLENAPAPLAVPAVAVGGALFGAGWVLIPALLRAYFNVNEILSTLLFNEFAFLLISYLLNGPMAEKTAITPKSEAFPSNSSLGLVIDGTRFHAGVLMALVALIAFSLFTRSTSGYKYDLYGENPKLATGLGISGPAVIVKSLLISGAAAGLVGWIQAAGLLQRLYADFAESIGFFGLVVAMLGAARPAGILAGALLLGALQSGGLAMQSAEGVPASLSDVIQALILLGFSVRYAPQIAALLRHLTRSFRIIPGRVRDAAP